MDDNLERELEKAIRRVDTDMLIRLWDVMEHDLYRYFLLVNIEDLWIKMTPQLSQHLSIVFITHEYAEVYNRVNLVSRFHEAILTKDFFQLKEAYPALVKTGIEENTLLNILSNNLDHILNSKIFPLISLMATYFCNSPYYEEYEKVCKTILEFLH